MRPLGLGAMRLSTSLDRDDARGLEVLTAAIDAGVTLIDTADAYGLDDADAGHNERLVAAARAARPDAALTIVTKGGLTRPGGAWVPDGRAKHLAAAARASRARLGGAPLDLYLLHAIDPQVPLATSVRALAQLVKQGVAAKVGLANVDRTRLLEALAITEIAAVEVELSPWNLRAVDGGLVELCAESGILVLAHRPFGGPSGVPRLARHPIIGPLATEHGVSPAVAALAWLRSLAPVVVPLPGPTRIHSDIARDLDLPRVPLTSSERSLKASASRDVVAAAQPLPHLDSHSPSADARSARAGEDPGEVVLILGPPGAGKSTVATELVAQGYYRLNRDERGGKLARLAMLLEGALAGGERRVVLDNTYASRASRAGVIAAAGRHGVPVRCVVMQTSIEDAQINAAGRLLARYGTLPDAAGLKQRKQDPNAFLPGAQFRWRREYEPPALDEGLAAIEERPFVRTRPTGSRRALIVELDGVAWTERPLAPHAIALRPGITEQLAAWQRAGWLVLGTTWQPDPLTPEARAEILAAARAQLPALAAIAACPHPAGPATCWCRKPLPGMALLLARDHDLDLAASIHAGTGPADRTFATRVGLRFLDASAQLPPP